MGDSVPVLSPLSSLGGSRGSRLLGSIAILALVAGCKARQEGGAPGGATLLGEDTAKAATGAGYMKIALSADDIEQLYGAVTALEPQESKSLPVSTGRATCQNHGIGEGTRIFCTFDLASSGPKTPMSAAEVEAFCQKLYDRELNLDGNALFKVTSECWLAGTVDHLEFISDRYELLELEEKLGNRPGQGPFVVGIDLFERRAVRSWTSPRISRVDFESLKSAALVYYPERFFRDRSWDWRSAQALAKDIDASGFRGWLMQQFAASGSASEAGDKQTRDAKAARLVDHLAPLLFSQPTSKVMVVPVSNPQDENNEYSFHYVIGDKVVVSLVRQLAI